MLWISLMNFMNDINILTYGVSAKGNYRNLERIHNACEDWVKHHDLRFNSKKYELLYLIRTLKKFNMKISIKIKRKEI
jgi:hypothetical protein